MFALPRNATLDMQQNGWNTASKIVCFQTSSILRQKRWAFSNFVFKTVELRFVYNIDAFQSSILFHLTIFLSTGDIAGHEP